MKYYIFLILSLILFVSCSTEESEDVKTFQSGQEYRTQIDSILAIMTLEEKVGQMTQFTSSWDVTGPAIDENYKSHIKAGRVGSVFNAHSAGYTRELQKIAVEETRTGIPLIFGYDVIHGFKTIFPISLGEAASWDLEIIEQSSRIAACEASAAGLHWTFAPMVDVSREPRWGRISEGAGEDPYLGSKIAVARVRGFQGDDLKDITTVVACAKHFIAYGEPQAGRDYHTVDISERTLRDIFLPPFKMALEAGVGTVMTAFNEYDGMPATGSRYLLTDLLKDELNFKGFIVTDYTSINELVPHGVARDEKDAARLAVIAGADMDMQGGTYMENLVQLVEEGEVDLALVDEAVRRILEIKFKLGLFEDPYRYSDEDREKATIMKPEYVEAARNIGRKSIVLLKNDSAILPLENITGRIALIGPLGNTNEVLGSWHGAGNYDHAVSLFKGLKENAPKGVSIQYAKGVDVANNDRSGIDQAVALALQSDVVILALGESEHMGGEAASRAQIGIPGAQMALFDAIKATGKPIIVVLMNSRPLAIPQLDEQADAILETWFLGTQAGNSIADVIYGKYNPSGKLPVTFPRSLGQVPIYYNSKNTGRPLNPMEKYTSRFLDESNDPLYPFGYGLSYTSFGYSDLTVEKATYQMDEEIRISVKVSNFGDRKGEEVVQLYVRDLVGSVTRPVRELKGFQKILLEPGQSRFLSFVLTQKDLAFTTKSMEFKAEPGDFKFWVGGSSTADLTGNFNIEK